MTKVLDEDDLTSNSDVSLATQQSIKAYIDSFNLVPSGTVMVFFQASAPTNWTQVATQNDKALRVVSGSGGGTGGTYGLASISSQSAGAHSHSDGTAEAGSFSTAGAASTDTHTAHTHTIDPLYIDVIIASRD